MDNVHLEDEQILENEVYTYPTSCGWGHGIISPKYVMPPLQKHMMLGKMDLFLPKKCLKLIVVAFLTWYGGSKRLVAKNSKPCFGNLFVLEHNNKPKK